MTATDDQVEVAARLIWFVFGEDMTVASALDPRNDAHWACWRDEEPARSAFAAARAILGRSVHQAPAVSQAEREQIDPMDGWLVGG